MYKKNENKIENYTDTNIEIFISKYNENIDYLKDEPFNQYSITIYNKGNEEYFKPQNLTENLTLNNVGVCVHSYLFFITKNYDNLPNITIFLPGSCMDQHKKEKTLKTIEKVKETNNSVFYCNHLDDYSSIYNFTLENWTPTNSENRSLNNDTSLRLCDIRPFGKWYDYVFNGININDINYHGIFAVSKQHILNRPKESYEELIEYVDKNKNEECAHYFERAFLSVFYPIDKMLVNFVF
jgi:hypothetical protein